MRKTHFIQHKPGIRKISINFIKIKSVVELRVASGVGKAIIEEPFSAGHGSWLLSDWLAYQLARFFATSDMFPVMLQSVRIVIPQSGLG